jgi:hypothetical protein
LPLQSL